MDLALIRFFAATILTLMLVACSDPYENVGRLQDVDIDEDAAVVEALPDPAELHPEGGFFSKFFGGDSGRDAASAGTVTFGQSVPYGDVGVLCGVPEADLGTAVGNYPEKGRGYTLYDSAPDSTAPHSFYISGFRDRCVRQVTGALVMFGAPSMHEQLHYGMPTESRMSSITDEAYETLKRRVCHVPRGEPCGAKIDRMDKSTVFVTVYENFGSNPRWAELLLHEGELLAQGIDAP
jgi:hypothetical protein